MHRLFLQFPRALSIAGPQQRIGDAKVNLIVHELLRDQPGLLCAVQYNGKIYGAVQHQRLQPGGNGVCDADIDVRIAGRKRRQNGWQADIQPNGAGPEAQHSAFLLRNI